MFDRVLVLSASAGAGHVRAGEAVKSAFDILGAARELQHADMLSYTNPVFRNLYSKLYIEMVKAMPEVLGWLYDRQDVPWKVERPKLAFDKLNARPVIRMLEQYQPEITVCTHSLPAEIISWLKSERRLPTQQAIVITDFDLHALWLVRNFEHYFVAIDETRAHLRALDVPADKISVTGIPIDPVFAEAKDQRAMRRRHGLALDRTTILVSAGGYGVGRVDTLMSSLLALRHRAQVVAVCGRNEELRHRLERLANERAPRDRVALKVIGYTNEMDELMAASDLVVGKPGGLTTSEALAKGLVYVVVNPIPGQEERNADHLLEEGAAIRCNNLPVLAYKIDGLLDDSARFKAMQANARRLGRPRAATEIVKRLLQWKEDARAPSAVRVQGAR